ncbi:3-hydroxyisobutyryl-CoA hydrolase, mitochondrial-like [Leguminivora glycinivorella]|uniref:3-hydroxyisobutyryl-CoA hydrolase, mitochondrial-like n=1 Tax=Leguminivora glycinivorella TaxID=1035111 RepID=UPI0020103091|nr:3-hydroxyisobutyryl-CoA hydrolase, mitochondrial-like [Leguminivora glycinivorella]
MGVALMLTANARFRVVTERTVVAMPEARIGWCAGASHFLSKLNNHLGFYMALTGKQLKSKDVIFSGVATHFVPRARLQELELELIHWKADDIETSLNAFSEPLEEFSLYPFIKDIDYCFSADTVEEIIEKLEKIDSEWSKEALEMMASLCPTMLKVSLRALQIGKSLDLKSGLRMLYRIWYRSIGSYNAQEGLKSISASGADRPRWQPGTLADVTDAMVDWYFEPLPDTEELRFYDD